MRRGIRASLSRALSSALAVSLLLAPLTAVGYVTDAGSHPPPTSGPYAYYPSSGTFGPTNSGFPGIGGTFDDPVFGSTIRRLTNEVGQQSDSEIYSRNGWWNADGTVVHHRSPNGRRFLNTQTGQVVRSNMPGNFDSSFAADDPDTWYYWENGSSELKKYSVSTGQSSTVKSFPGALSAMGGSTDWIDGSGRYMVFRISGNIRVWDKQTDTLYSGNIPGQYGGGNGWTGISPDGNYVITSTSGAPTQSHSWKINHDTKSVSTSPTLFWTLCGGHGDVVGASNGKTYYVTLDCHTSAALFAVDVSLSQSAGNVQKQINDNKKLVPLTWSDDVHISRVSRGANRDWAFASIESGGDGYNTNPTSTWWPYKQEIIQVNVLTGEIRRLAHHRSRGDLGDNYFAQPRPSSSWDGTKIAWVSNMGHSQNGYSDLYVVQLGTSPPPPPPPPPPPGVTLGFTNPANNATVSGTVTVSLNATPAGSYTYTVKAGTTTIFSGTNPSFSWNTTGSANGATTLTASVSGSSATATRTVTVSNSTGGGGGNDTTPPTVKFTLPTGNVWTGNSIDLAATASDNTALSKIELWGNGQRFKTVTCNGTSCNTGTVWWSTGALTGAAYQVHAVAIDAAGNKTLSAPVLIYKKGTSPVIPSGAAGGSTTPPPGGGTGDTTKPTVQITTPTANVWTGNSIDLAATASDNTALSRIELWGNGQLFRTVNCTGTSCNTGRVWWSTGALTGNAYQVHAVAVDAAGNRTLSTPILIYKNGTSPVIPSGAN